jgi:ribokinase
LSKDLVIVVGSVNSDLFLLQDRLPAKGETLLAAGLREGFGGKGANQAVQCARLGQSVAFIGAVGDDERGRASRLNLEREGIECRLAVSDHPTGLGFVQVLPDGEVHATIVEGANGDVTPGVVEANAELFTRAGVVIVQNEVPVDAVRSALALAVANRVVIVYNAAPARTLDRSLSRACDFLVVNEEEAAFLAGRALRTEADVVAALPLLQDYCANLVVTLGSAGSIAALGDQVHRVAPVSVDAVDTTGAGDAFVGAFSAALNEGHPPLGAARFASEVAAAATLAVGAQAGMPVRKVPKRDSLRAQDPNTRPAV